MTRWTAGDLPDMSGRTVLITGAGSGIGLIAAREFGRVGARVVLGVRSVDRAKAAVADLPGDLELRHLDVSDLDSVRDFAGSWPGPLDILVNNAGVMDVPQRRMREPLRSVLAHPGIAATSLAAHSPAGRINRLSFLLNDAEHGALPTLYAATQDVPPNAYVGPDGIGSIKGYPLVRRPGASGRDAHRAENLWQATATLTGLR